VLPRSGRSWHDRPGVSHVEYLGSARAHDRQRGVLIRVAALSTV
jgi:hypothetical protein